MGHTAALVAALSSGAVSSEALLERYLDRISEGENLGAFLDVDVAGARAQAREVDRLREEGAPLGDLAGVPVAVKDNIHIKGRKTTCASRILEDFVAPFDAHVVERLRKERAILIGKTNLDEFAMGSSTEYSALKVTRHPLDPDRVPGGSSGGSTAAVAADMAPLALGSSTGGSIRQPAAFCGVVGMKPTYGRVSRFGLVAYGSSLDQIGPIARDVEGARLLYRAIAGQDQRDSTSAVMPVSSPDVPTPASWTIGVARAWLNEGLQPEIRSAFDRLVCDLENAGVSIRDIELPHTAYAIPAYYLVATAEASSNLARFDGMRYSKRSQQVSNLKEMYVRSRSEGFGPEVKRRILLGTYCLSSGYYEGYYLNAQRMRTKIADDYQQAFKTVDAILAPTTPTTAFRFGEKTQDPVSMYLGDIFTVTANLAGLPALSLPTGNDDQGLPIGLQLMAPRFQEDNLFALAQVAEDLVKQWD